MKKAIICFTRVPKPGTTKTRLLGMLTPEQCVRLHWAFLQDLSRIYPALDADLFISHTPDPDWIRLAGDKKLCLDCYETYDRFNV